MKPIGFIIITYNRNKDTIELLESISVLYEVENLVEEIIVLDNASTGKDNSLKDYIRTSSLPIIYIEAGENLGVAKGRNYAIKHSRAGILIMVDDDALLKTADCLHKIIDEFEVMDEQKKIAIISFKVLYFDSLEMQETAFPHKKFKEYKNKQSFETYYFAGGAHAIKREAIIEAGLYPENFFYGMEEYDLSYRLLDAQYSIYYSVGIEVLHKESPLGRKPKEEKIRMMWVNKCKVAYKFLPLRYFYSTAFMWSFQYLKISGFNLKGLFKGWKEIAKVPRIEKRMAIDEETLMYIKSLQPRLWY